MIKTVLMLELLYKKLDVMCIRLKKNNLCSFQFLVFALYLSIGTKRKS